MLTYRGRHSVAAAAGGAVAATVGGSVDSAHEGHRCQGVSHLVLTRGVGSIRE